DKTLFCPPYTGQTWHPSPKRSRPQRPQKLLNTTATEKEQRLKVSPFRAVGTTFIFGNPAKCKLLTIYRAKPLDQIPKRDASSWEAVEVAYFTGQVDLARLYNAGFPQHQITQLHQGRQIADLHLVPLHGSHSSKFQEAHFTVQWAFGSCLPTAGVGASPATTQRSVLINFFLHVIPETHPTSRTLILTTDRMFEDCPR
ncbi:unnamed protein product, partial [Colletotrichum noveboracense]